MDPRKTQLSVPLLLSLQTQSGNRSVVGLVQDGGGPELDVSEAATPASAAGPVPSFSPSGAAASLPLQRLRSGFGMASDMTGADSAVQREPNSTGDGSGSPSPEGQPGTAPTPGSSHKAVVINNIDPQAQNRLQVQVPDAGGQPAWALPAGNPSGPIPAIGDEVTVQYDQGDTDHPTWSSDTTTP